MENENQNQDSSEGSNNPSSEGSNNPSSGGSSSEIVNPALPPPVEQMSFAEFLQMMRQMPEPEPEPVLMDNPIEWLRDIGMEPLLALAPRDPRTPPAGSHRNAQHSRLNRITARFIVERSLRFARRGARRGGIRGGRLGGRLGGRGGGRRGGRLVVRRLGRRGDRRGGGN